MRKFDLIIVDGRHLLWRCADAYKTLSATIEVGGEEISTGGIYGFLMGILRVSRKYRGLIVVAWEGTNNFRYELFPGYKAREGQQDLLSREMDEQQDRLSEILRALGVRQYSGRRCEADDVIGRLSRLSERGHRVAIYSGDSDLRQLVNRRVTVIAPERGRDKLYGVAAVREKHEVPPSLIAPLKALAGDASDKIPGVPGVGQKTAAALLNAYAGTPDPLESVIDAAHGQGDGPEWPVAERFRPVVAENEAAIHLFHKLTTIKTDVRLIAIRPNMDQQEVMRLLKLYKFRSLVFSPDLGALMRVGGGK